MKNTEIRRFNKILVANRGEIAVRILRAASELKIRTVAIFTFEDRYSLHRYKADEAYQIGTDDDPLKPYLDIEEIILLAKQHGVDAIHPGYGFLSENTRMARRCGEEGITFVGPEPEVMEQLGDKVAAKNVAIANDVPIIQDSKEKLDSPEKALAEAKKIGFPVMLKAASGGGGRGMRVVREEGALKNAFTDASSEAQKAFGDDTVFIEKFIDNPKHIEVQIMADNHGNIVHLYERDCSVQRRFQKVVEMAPSATLSQDTRDKLYEYALKITRGVDYNNVGTVEFLVDADQNVYFIEVNPRIQVEHTITEEVTGVDIVRSQILIAEGYPLHDKRIFIKSQDDVQCNGFAIQCRITTEDPEKDFRPDYGTIIAYRNAAGFGIRLDEGNCYPGVKVSPFFDSMLVKVSAWGRTLKGATQRLHRALREFRIRGVSTNIGFLENVLKHPDFYRGEATVGFIANNPDLFKLPPRRDRGTRTLRYLADVCVNGNPDIGVFDPGKKFRTPKVPAFDRHGPYPEGTKDKLNQLGREGFVDWLKQENKIQITDTTWRDAHQSLLATRLRGTDIMAVAEGYAKHHPQLFSLEMWGGATFDVTMRFLKEDPWKRLQRIRQAVPNILLQMLLRGSNAVGYKAYPDNLIERFIVKAAENGMDVFRIFDSLNWLEAMKVSIKTVREETNSLAEVAMCYTGDLQDPANTKYTLQYYVDLARRIEDEGAHILSIKDMAGLLKPYAATELVGALKEAVSLPLHLHTHDTSSMQPATYLKAIEAGVDAIDCAIGSMSGLTSQPNLNALQAVLQGHERANPMDQATLSEYSTYWQDVREYYYPFESGLKSGQAEVYNNEIPGGQYSNLRRQADALGVLDNFETVIANYATVNRMFGHIVKVTPSSKVVGDMAIFMTSNHLTEEDIMTKGATLNFPESVINFFKGDLGQPEGGFPAELQRIVLRDVKPFTERPNAYLDPIDFDKEFAAFQQQYGADTTELDFLSHQLYPKVFKDYWAFRDVYGDISAIPTLPFFFGMKVNEEILVEIQPGKKIIIKLIFISEPDDSGMRIVYFDLNGQERRISVKDQSASSTKVSHAKATEDHHVGAPLQGKLSAVLAKPGDTVDENTPLFVIEAMKMESTITAPAAGTVAKVHLAEGELVEQDDLVVSLEK